MPVSDDDRQWYGPVAADIATPPMPALAVSSRADGQALIRFELQRPRAAIRLRRVRRIQPQRLWAWNGQLQERHAYVVAFTAARHDCATGDGMASV